MFQSLPILPISSFFCLTGEQGLTRHKYQYVPVNFWLAAMYSHNLVGGCFDEIVDWVNHMPSGDIVHSALDK